MKIVSAYLIILLLAILVLFVAFLQNMLPPWVYKIELLFQCILVGGVGGVFYCLRGIYLNACVRKNWDTDWLPWYYIRPLVSLLGGGVSYLFLKAGLIVLESSQNSSSTNLGFLALAFIAGLNVDKFISKIEEIAQGTWGIDKSRTANLNKEK